MNSAHFVSGKSTDISSFSWLKNQLNSARFLVYKISLFSLVFLADSFMIFCSLSLHENQLLSAQFCGWKFNRFQFVLMLRKLTEFSSFSCLQNQLSLTHFFAEISTEFSSFSWPDNHLNSARFPGMFRITFVAEKSTFYS